jgi:hypothetical protein
VQRDRQPGDKLLPKISAAVIQSVIATKLGLTGHEHNVRVNAGQELIDRMGREHADLMRVFFKGAESDPRLQPEIQEFMERVLSGAHQWEATAGFRMLAGTAASALGTIISDALAPLVRDIVVKTPNLVPDPATLAQMYAAGFLTDGNYEYWVQSQGFQSAFASSWLNLATNWPDLPTSASLYNRGIVDLATAKQYLRNNAIPETIVDQVDQLFANIPTVQDAALAVLRTDITVQQGQAYAHANGYTDNDFNLFLDNTGEPPGPESLMEAYRRGFIDEATFKLGIAQSRVRDQWVDTLLELRYSPISTSDAVNAYVEGYITEKDLASYADQNGLEPTQYKILADAAGDPLSYTDMMRLWRYGYATQQDVEDALRRGRLKDDYIPFALKLKDAPMSVPDAIEASIQGYLPKQAASEIALMNGLREQDFDPLWATAGDPASRTEMIQLWRRGEVTEQDVIAALKQSRLKDSYVNTVLKLKVQLPALYETRALLADGGLSAEQGTQILLAQGYDDTIVKAIVANAIGSTTDIHKALTEAQVVDLYKEQFIDTDELITELTGLGYTQVEAELIQAIADDAQIITQRNAVIGKIRAAYTGHRITEQQALDMLNQEQVPAAAGAKYVADWNVIIETEVKQLSAAQVADAWQMNLFNADDVADNLQQALTYLVNLGYSSDDAITLIEIKNKGPLDNGTTNQSVSGGTSTPSQTGGTG